MMFHAFSGVQRCLALAALASFAALSCTTDDPAAGGEPECLETAGPTDCSASYGYDIDSDSVRPTFTQVYENTLKPRCASAGCHTGDSPQGGMWLGGEEAGAEDRAFDAIHANGSNGVPRVKGGDIQCGKVIVRLETHGETWSMPPGTPLRDADLCSVRNWINNGAER